MIDDSFNILKRITRSILFPLITLLELALQVLIVSLGKSVFHVANNGLTGEQWGICIGFSAITFVVCILAKLMPIEKIIDSYLGSSDKKEKEIEKEKGKDKDAISDSTIENSNINLRIHVKKKLYDQAIPKEEKRYKEPKDLFKLSEESSS